MANTSHTCLRGYNYDAAHATCLSCVRQLGPCKVKSTRRKVAADDRWWTCGNVFVCTKPLLSMNHWHLKSRHVYLTYKKEWAHVLAGTWVLWGKATGKRELIVRSYAKRPCADRDNLIGGIKPVKDILVAYGVLLDDTDDLCTFSIEQFTSDTNTTEIEVRNVI